MKTKILIGLLLISFVLVSGCTIMNEEVTEPIPKEFYGTTSLEYGQVSQTGEVEFTPTDLANGLGGAEKRGKK